MGARRLGDDCAPAHAGDDDAEIFPHLRDSSDEILDPDGIELPSEAIAGAALMAARDCMAGDVKDGQLDLRYRIDVHDDSGELVHSLPFPDAVQIVTASHPSSLD